MNPNGPTRNDACDVGAGSTNLTTCIKVVESREGTISK